MVTLEWDPETIGISQSYEPGVEFRDKRSVIVKKTNGTAIKLKTDDCIILMPTNGEENVSSDILRIYNFTFGHEPHDILYNVWRNGKWGSTKYVLYDYDCDRIIKIKCPSCDPAAVVSSAAPAASSAAPAEHKSVNVSSVAARSSEAPPECSISRRRKRSQRRRKTSRRTRRQH